MDFLIEAWKQMRVKLSRFAKGRRDDIYHWLSRGVDNPDERARQAAFEITGLQIAPEELIDPVTGDLYWGSQLRDAVRQEMPVQMEGLSGLMFEHHVQEAKRRYQHYAGFETTLAREMKKSVSLAMGEDDESSRYQRRELMKLTAGDANVNSSNILIYFTLYGQPRNQPRHMRAARELLQRWPVYHSPP